MKRILFIGIAAILLMTTIAYGQTISRQPYGFSTPKLYPMDATTQVVSSYYLALPTLTANDTAAGLAATQTFTNKTLTSPTITSPTITGTIAGGPIFTSPVLTTPQINDTSADHQYVFAVSELAADRIVTLPLLAGADTFVFNDFTATLTNKTLTSPKINTSILDANGAVMFGFSPQTTAVNYLQFLNSPANTNLTINLIGTSTNISLSLNSKGTGGFNFQTQVATDDSIVIQPYVGGSAYFSGTITSVDLTTPAKVWTFPNLTGTVTLTTNKLSVFAATSSAELAGVISDEQGSGALVFANTPTLVTPEIGVATGTSLATSAQNIFSATAGTAPVVARSATATDDDLRLLPYAGGAGRFAGIITSADLTADQTYTLPNVAGNIITSGDTGTVVTAMIANNAVTSTLLNEGTIKFAEVSLSNAQILALLTTPVQVVAAPGEGKVISFVDAIVIHDVGTADFATAHNVTINYKADGSGAIVSTTLVSPFISGAVADKISTLKQIVTDITTADKTTQENQPLVIKASANPITGNGVGRVKVWYRVFSTGL